MTEQRVDGHTRQSFFEYDPDERWLIENDGFGASRIAARDVTPEDGKRLPALLNAAAQPTGSEALAKAVDRYVVAVTRHASGRETLEAVDHRYAELLDARAALNASTPAASGEEGWRVHDHGPQEGRGIACREYHLNGRLVGACLVVAATTPAAREERPEIAVSGVDGAGRSDEDENHEDVAATVPGHRAGRYSGRVHLPPLRAGNRFDAERLVAASVGPEGTADALTQSLSQLIADLAKVKWDPHPDGRERTIDTDYLARDIAARLAKGWIAAIDAAEAEPHVTPAASEGGLDDARPGRAS